MCRSDHSAAGIFPLHYILQNDSDFFFGFGHDRRENNLLSVKPANTLTDAFGTSELYVLFENIAEIELSPEAIAAGLKLTPDRCQAGVRSGLRSADRGKWHLGRRRCQPNLVEQRDRQHSPECGGRRNQLLRFRQDESRSLVMSSPSRNEVVLAGTAFQHDEERNTEIRFDLTWPIDLDEPFDVFDTSLSTDECRRSNERCRPKRRL